MIPRRKGHPRRVLELLISVGLTVILGACQSFLIHSSDREVFDLIQDQQQAAIGFTAEATSAVKPGDLEISSRAYKFHPSPLEADLPKPFDLPASRPTTPPAEKSEEKTEQNEVQEPTPPKDEGQEDELDSTPKLSQSIFTEDQLDQVTVFGLDDALAYAIHHARALQDAKEDLYLAALDLSLERHLWTPLFTARSKVEYTDPEKGAPLDRSLTTISEVAVSQRLPLGGNIAARVIHSLVRDIVEQVNKGENGQLILSGTIPLLRGAGRVAYESRYVRERELIYAVRRFERFRRTFLVDIARDYFNLQQNKTAIANTYRSYLNRRQDWVKADFRRRVGRSRTISEAPRARANFRDSEAALVSAKERYDTALDRFKIRMAMPVDQLFDVVDQDKDEAANAVDDLLVEVDPNTAADIAIRYRLDLLNDADQIDDARRGVVIARNRILPDLDISGDVTFDSDPNQLRATNLRKERATWRGSVEMRIDDRKTELNAFRAALISLRRARRDHELFMDSVRADVRRAIRRILQQEDLKAIQEANVKENDIRLQGARAQFEAGRSTNQDVVDAENDLLGASNRLAAAEAAYRIAILEFRRDTGTLRITEEGRWGMFSPTQEETSAPQHDRPGS